jgi:hypothetical protein
MSPEQAEAKPVDARSEGLAYQFAGRRELQERRSRGEYVTVISFLSIYIGAGDMPAVRRALADAIAEHPPPSPCVSPVSLSLKPSARTPKSIACLSN